MLGKNCFTRSVFFPMFMPMLKQLTHIFIALAVLTCVPNGYSQSEQKPAKQVRPGSIFLSGYYSIAEAEKLEKGKRYKDAWNKYHQALRYYRTLAANFPEWKKGLVESRIKSTKQTIARIEPLAQKEQEAKQAQFQKYIESNTSENGIKSPAIIEMSDVEKKRIDRLIIDANAAQQSLQQERAKHKQEVARLGKQIGKLQDDLRKATQGLGGENTQTKILNQQIARLNQKLQNEEKLSKETQRKYQATLNQLHRERARLAVAPLQRDVELLKKERDQNIADLKNMVAVHRATLEKQRVLNDKYNTLARDLDLAQRSLKKKSDELEKSKKAGHKVVAALRKQNKALQSQVTALQTQLSSVKTENEILQEQLTQSEAVNAELKRDLAAVTLERDNLNELIKLSDTDRVKKVIKENLRLGKELHQIRLAYKKLQEDKNASQDQLIEAENKLAVAKQKIINLEEIKAQYQKRIGDLEDHLRTTKDRLAQVKENGSPLEQEEAQVLKDTLKRITLQLERRKQAEALLWKEYTKSAYKDSELGKAIQAVMNKKIALTEKEKGLLKMKRDTDSFVLSNSGNMTAEQRRIKLERSDAQVDSLSSLAKRCIERGSLQTAKEIYDEAYADHGYHYPFLVNRGVVRVQLNEYEEALEIFEHSSQLKERNAYSHFMLGYCRFKLGMDDLAKKSFDEAIRIRPDHIDSYLYHGLIAYSQSNYKGAQEYFENAVRLNPDHREAQFNLSQVYFAMKQKTKAKEAYNSALRAGLTPNFAYEKRLGINKSQRDGE